MKIVTAPQCNCISEITEKIKEMEKVEKVELQEIDLLTHRTFTNAKLGNGKRPKSMILAHAYCPWCGKEYNNP